MRLSRRNAGLLGLVLVLSVIELSTLGGRSAARLPRAVLPDFSPARAASIRIDADGQTVELVRSPPVVPEGAPRSATVSGWSVRERHDFPAHAGAVESLLARLANLRSDDLVATESASHARFGIGPETPRITVSNAAGSVLLDVQVARNPEGAGSFVRISNGDEVYRAPALPSTEAAPDHWVDTRLAAFDVGAVAHVELVGPTPAAVPLYLMREEDGRWGVAGETHRLLPADVDPLLLTAANLYFDRVESVAPESAGLLEPHWSLRLELTDGASVQILLGPPLTGDVPRSATRPGWPSPWVVRLSSKSAQRLEALMVHLTNAGR